jgi:hypothetical protein
MSDVKSKQESKLDRTVEDSFPASDPPSHTPAIGSRKAEQHPEQARDEPKGLPTSDRHAAETVAGRIAGAQPAERHDP